MRNRALLSLALLLIAVSATTSVALPGSSQKARLGKLQTKQTRNAAKQRVYELRLGVTQWGDFFSTLNVYVELQSPSLGRVLARAECRQTEKAAGWESSVTWNMQIPLDQMPKAKITGYYIECVSNLDGSVLDVRKKQTRTLEELLLRNKHSRPQSIRVHTFKLL